MLIERLPALLYAFRSGLTILAGLFIISFLFSRRVIS